MVHLVAPELGFKPSSLVKVQTESSAVAGTPYLKDNTVFHSQAHTYGILVITEHKGEEENELVFHREMPFFDLLCP